MADAPVPREPGKGGEPRSWRFVMRAMLVVYLISLPACTSDAGHFGPGFFPLLAALFLVPVFAMVSFVDAVLAWGAVTMKDGVRANLPAAAFMSLVTAGYWALIVLVIVEKSGG
ncbi:MAG: hypothetical protein ACOY3X_09485 [Pseudomonadota bacterium]